MFLKLPDHHLRSWEIEQRKLWVCLSMFLCSSQRVYVHINNELLVCPVFCAFSWAKQTVQNDIWLLIVIKLITSARQPQWPSCFALIRSMFTTLFLRIKQHNLATRRDAQSCNTKWSQSNTWRVVCLGTRRYSHETLLKDSLKWDNGQTYK